MAAPAIKPDLDELRKSVDTAAAMAAPLAAGR